VTAVTEQAQQVQQHAQQLLQKADAEIASLKAQLVHQEEQAKDKSQELEIKNYDSETKRLQALGSVDPMLVQMIARQLWENMQQTDITPHIHSHAELEGALAGKAQPPQPMNGSGVVMPSGASPQQTDGDASYQGSPT
jgi:hypothetical protein